MSSFIHLHNHSDFTLLDSTQSIDSILNRIDDLSMDSVGLTEKENLFSMIPFYKKAKKKGIKPILGCEVNVCLQSYANNQLYKSHNKNLDSHHLLLLVTNQIGYLNFEEF